ncbi:hypothetical protein [Ignicoccus hospitalis]|uniref:Phosphate transport regulator n=1 Tax=Ignicoccus hospitalis (strain KIN4/I / DSM 18386 / JCM 14125) TaxID=453591 RepID=A8A8Q3_IGNH4|nr:hypothetical protein [Ignicoccus hospitalis]ABU81305.1 hypothetical protein Igni_0121 [Ignicoccus hospitalis KIN4/I]HIH90391.1 hypothetical protein [Desulfurococcaceae archaeon]
MEEEREVDYLEPETQAKVYSSIAEINLIETLNNLMSSLTEEIRAALSMVEKAKGGTAAEVDASLQSVRELKENIENYKDKAMEYLVRLPAGLIMKDTFMPIVLGISNAAQYVDGSCYRLGVLAKRGKAHEELVLETQELLNLLLEQAERLAKAARVVTEPKMAMKYVNESIGLEDEIDRAYRSKLMDVLEGSKDCASAVLSWEILGNLEDASDILKDVAENLKYFLMHKV